MQKEKFTINKCQKFPEDITKESKKSIHFIGLGGIGMSGLAKFLLSLGYKVSGSDIKDGPNMFSISTLGGTVFVGHSRKNVEDASLVVVSSAIKQDNPELIEAQARNIPIMHRSQILEALMSGLGRDKNKKQISIGVSGTHGKTTTTGMVSLILEDNALNPSVVVGGMLPILNTNSKVGGGKYFVAELDESDGTIEFYQPDVSIITNLETDHIDHYTGGFDQLIETFTTYIKNLKPDNKIILNADCPGNMELLSKVDHPGVILYSTKNEESKAKIEYCAKEIEQNGFVTTAKIFKSGVFIGKLKLQVPGEHNISNALGAIAFALEYGISFEKAAAALEKFSGMKRRFQLLGSVNDIQVVDDYAHHPTEVSVTLSSANKVVRSANKGRVVAIFQPHRFTRLHSLWNDFTSSFEKADLTYITDVYRAGEQPIEGACPNKLASEIKGSESKYIQGSLENIAKTICPDLRPDDIVLTIGAGDITKLGNLIMEKLNAGAGN